LIVLQRILKALAYMKRNKKWFIGLVTVVATLVFVGIFRFSSTEEVNAKDAESPIETVPVVQVAKQDVQAELEYVADIQAIQNVEIRARVEGYLDRIHVDEGHFVSKGQLLFSINNEEYQAAVNKALAVRKSAEAEMLAAEVEVRRVKQLADKKVISETELELAKAKLQIAKSKVEEAKADEQTAQVSLAHCQIRSPFAGRIDRIPFRIGSLITEGSLLTTISDMEAVYAYFRVSELEYLDYFKANKDSIFDQQVALVLADGTTYTEKGEIETMAGEFEEGTAAIALRARFRNQNHFLKHGSSGKIRIVEKIKNALVIPQTAVLEIQDKNYVYTVDKNNTVYMKSFEAHSRHGDNYIVRKGLSPGETIVAQGVQNLRDGAVILTK
jgi:membrane fusion protein, multidrug efflux system